MSYKINSRSGDENDFADMTRRCNAVGIRIYPDAVINHMSASSGLGVSGSKADRNLYSFSGVPYSRLDFNAPCGINDYQNANEVRNCNLNNLADLNQGVDWVRQKIVEYLNHLIDLGAGE